MTSKLATSQRSSDECVYDIPVNEESVRLHLFHSFFLVAQTGKGVQTFMMTLGASGYRRASADITLAMLKDVMH
jgi:hypothetical protein